jgi:hypothetical protein
MGLCPNLWYEMRTFTPVFADHVWIATGAPELYQTPTAKLGDGTLVISSRASMSPSTNRIVQG